MATVADEARALRVSLIANAVLSLGALALGLVLGIRVLVFDGAFGIIGMVTTWMALGASRKALQDPTRRNPFGWPALVPLVVAVQGVAALATLVIAAGDAVIVIADGGQDIAVGVVAGYGVVLAVGSGIVAWWLGRTSSDLVHAEALDWRGSAIRAAVVAAGAGVAAILSAASVTSLLPYVDPVLVLASCVLVAPLPISLVRHGVGELLEGAPPAGTAAQVDAAVVAVTDARGLSAPVVRAAKLGHRLYLEVIYHVEPGRWSIDEQDEIRRDILTRLDGLGLEVWPSIELTTDPGFD
ncbi:cation transporter [Microbacterium terricola]|uniref:Cation transporter n=1 Tax=Microbacterium terricola TaxID=344163 RepID=A0ABM8DVZ7_9MICO|nr:cation transporter [Microbacterium terricola]UYK39623.1 cation transporter [Microbacterium terricola]BDV29636.1 cation transporter [Microbacterium terricola]